MYHARRDDGKSFAVKVLKHRYGSDPAFETRFRQEATLAAGLRHPNIVHIEEVGAEGGMVFFVMDFYPDNLAARNQREPVMAESDVVPIAIGVGEALGFAHDQDIVHRDIKPDNMRAGRRSPSGSSVSSSSCSPSIPTIAIRRRRHYSRISTISRPRLGRRARSRYRQVI